jgi:predicted Zn-dependent protease
VRFGVLPRMTHRYCLPLAAAAALVAAPAGPVVAQAAQSISASDKATGAKAHPQFVQEFGGQMRGPVADYVERVGRRIAVQSGLSGSERDFTVTLLDSPVNNAFAVPGGYVYVTRGLLALINDEAELASVLGHEVGHVAARHAAKRQQTSQITSVLAGLVGAVAGNSGLGSLVGRGAGAGAELITRGFSRTQEYQADDLGVLYLSRAGYDTGASADMLGLLAAQEALDARTTGRDGSVPTWASTHPNSLDRVARARKEARELGGTDRPRNRDAFLDAIDGLVYGDDPQKGYVQGQDFLLPVQRIAFPVPRGFTVDNGEQAVTVAGSGGRAIFAAAPAGRDLAEQVDRVFAGLSSAGVHHDAARTDQVGGVARAFAFGRANSNAGVLDVGVFVYRIGTDSYSIVTLTPDGRGVGPFQPLVEGMRRLSPAEAANVRPMRIRVVKVGAGDSVASLAARMAFSDYRTERFLTLNGLASDARLAPGQRVKLIVR